MFRCYIEWENWDKKYENYTLSDIEKEIEEEKEKMEKMTEWEKIE